MVLEFYNNLRDEVANYCIEKINKYVEFKIFDNHLRINVSKIAGDLNHHMNHVSYVLFNRNNINTTYPGFKTVDGVIYEFINVKNKKLKIFILCKFCNETNSITVRVNDHPIQKSFKEPKENKESKENESLKNKISEMEKENNFLKENILGLKTQIKLLSEENYKSLGENLSILLNELAEKNKTIEKLKLDIEKFRMNQISSSVGLPTIPFNPGFYSN
jgi:hypothetical protein